MRSCIAEKFDSRFKKLMFFYIRKLSLKKFTYDMSSQNFDECRAVMGQYMYSGSPHFDFFRRAGFLDVLGNYDCHIRLF